MLIDLEVEDMFDLGTTTATTATSTNLKNMKKNKEPFENRAFRKFFYDEIQKIL